MKKLPIERSVLKFNGELEIDNDLGYGEEIVVVIKARVGAPAFTELKHGLKQINKAEVVSLHLATTDAERVELEMYLDGGLQLPLPFTDAEAEEATGEPVYVLDQEAPVAYLAEPEADDDDLEPVKLDSPRRRPAGTSDPILARFLESDR